MVLLKIAIVVLLCIICFLIGRFYEATIKPSKAKIYKILSLYLDYIDNKHPEDDNLKIHQYIYKHWNDIKN